MARPLEARRAVCKTPRGSILYTRLLGRGGYEIERANSAPILVNTLWNAYELVRDQERREQLNTFTFPD